ncbi:MAG: pilus assembly protein [Propionibacteriaceae bacterium]|nr:pilus assembly protein [Propionibacteriaceae bacterium]
MRDQRGLNNGVQYALLFPVALGILLLTLQWAMVSWADSTALAAAQDGARVAALANGSAVAGESIALDAAQNGSLNGVAVAITRGATRTSVTVTGSATSVLPGFAPQVSKTAEVATERLTRP